MPAASLSAEGMRAAFSPSAPRFVLLQRGVPRSRTPLVAVAGQPALPRQRARQVSPSRAVAALASANPQAPRGGGWPGSGLSNGGRGLSAWGPGPRMFLPAPRLLRDVHSDAPLPLAKVLRARLPPGCLACSSTRLALAASMGAATARREGQTAFSTTMLSRGYWRARGTSLRIK